MKLQEGIAEKYSVLFLLLFLKKLNLHDIRLHCRRVKLRQCIAGAFPAVVLSVSYIDSSGAESRSLDKTS